jgi:hypothetical protein
MHDECLITQRIISDLVPIEATNYCETMVHLSLKL